jgi:hypothetical protein
MSDVLDSLTPRDRKLVRDMAADAKSTPDLILPAIVSAYLTLMRDAPAVLPNNPMAGLQARANRGVVGS